MKFVICGIGTNIGKTIVSAILAEHLKASYWKPIQSGDLNNSDSKKIGDLTENVTVIPERFRLTQAFSPHFSAEMDGVNIEIDDLEIPNIEGNLIIEGAGGVMVPINSHGLTFIDVFQKWQLPVIIVSKHYLGSINHTLMTLEALKHRKIEIAGIIFVGDENKSSEDIILRIGKVKMLARIPLVKEIDKDFIIRQAELLIGKIPPPTPSKEGTASRSDFLNF